MSEYQVMAFWLGNEEYGIGIEDIQEIDRLNEIIINKIPKVPSFIEGIVNLRGDVVPVINLRKKFGMVDEDTSKSRRIIIVDIQSNIVGLLVDRISGTASLKEEEVFTAPVEWDKNNEYISRLGKMDNRIIFLLDAGKIIGL
jgi:purine-binding chemotaxis protein CheW